MISLVRRGDWMPVLWKNGLGITHELFREPGPGPEGFALRLSAARVDADSPFSSFPGIDRTICLLEGPGFDLERPDGATARIRGPWPFSFHGEDAWRCRLAGGPVTDFNVMVDRATTRATVHLASHHFGQPDVTTAVLALDAGVLTAEGLLGRHDLVVFRGEGEIRGRCLVVQWVSES